jgi:hypothetical protein
MALLGCSRQSKRKVDPNFAKATNCANRNSNPKAHFLGAAELRVQERPGSFHPMAFEIDYLTFRRETFAYFATF